MSKSTIEKILTQISNEENLFYLSEFFKVFGDHTRIKIICALLKKELCVGSIAELTQVSQSAISHQMRILKQSGIVKYRREGKMVFYSLDDEHIEDIITIALDHLEHKY